MKRYAIIFIIAMISQLVACQLDDDDTDDANAIEEKDVVDNVETPLVQQEMGEMIAYFLDVDQGDATLLVGDDFTVLIDAGRHDRKDVVKHLQEIGITELDLLVGTHPHADHIGQFPDILQTFPVKEVWLSGNDHPTKTYEKTIEAIFHSEAEYYEPRAGEIFEIGSLILEVLNPVEIKGDLHDGSISLRARFGETAVVFTGDAETPTEEKIIERGFDLKANVFHLGHHGSTTSNSKRFLKAIDPEIAIYSAGVDNEYGHPHREIVALLDELQIETYGTAVHGTITLTSDGTSYTLETEKGKATGKEEGAPNGCIDINKASASELEKIVHIGKERVDELIRLRPYASVEELTKINGIGSGRIKDIVAEKLACVH